MITGALPKQLKAETDKVIEGLYQGEEPFLTRKEAPEYLLEKYGAPCTVTATTLAKLAHTGGGPIMHRFGRRVGYLKKDLDVWALSRCSGPVRSTSDKPRLPVDKSIMPGIDADAFQSRKRPSDISPSHLEAENNA